MDKKSNKKFKLQKFILFTFFFAIGENIKSKFIDSFLHTFFFALRKKYGD